MEPCKGWQGYLRGGRKRVKQHAPPDRELFSVLNLDGPSRYWGRNEKAGGKSSQGYFVDRWGKRFTKQF